MLTRHINLYFSFYSFLFFLFILFCLAQLVTVALALMVALCLDAVLLRLRETLVFNRASQLCCLWDCHNIPKSLDSLTGIDIKGPAYDKIEITVTQTPTLIVLASILSVVFLFLYNPSFATGIIVGGFFSSGGSTSRSLES